MEDAATRCYTPSRKEGHDANGGFLSHRERRDHREAQPVSIQIPTSVFAALGFAG